MRARAEGRRRMAMRRVEEEPARRAEFARAMRLGRNAGRKPSHLVLMRRTYRRRP
jgi:hypothetical protein